MDKMPNTFNFRVWSNPGELFTEDAFVKMIRDRYQFTFDMGPFGKRQAILLGVIVDPGGKSALLAVELIDIYTENLEAYKNELEDPSLKIQKKDGNIIYCGKYTVNGPCALEVYHRGACEAVELGEIDSTLREAKWRDY